MIQLNGKYLQKRAHTLYYRLNRQTRRIFGHLRSPFTLPQTPSQISDPGVIGQVSLVSPYSLDYSYCALLSPTIVL